MTQPWAQNLQTTASAGFDTRRRIKHGGEPAVSQQTHHSELLGGSEPLLVCTPLLSTFLQETPSDDCGPPQQVRVLLGPHAFGTVGNLMTTRHRSCGRGLDGDLTMHHQQWGGFAIEDAMG